MYELSLQVTRTCNATDEEMKKRRKKRAVEGDFRFLSFSSGSKSGVAEDFVFVKSGYGFFPITDSFVRCLEERAYKLHMAYASCYIHSIVYYHDSPVLRCEFITGREH